MADYPGQHWLGVDPHRETAQRPIDSLADLTMPTLVVSGERDVPCFRELSAVLAAGIPGAESVQVSGAGHMVNMEEPEAVSALIARFLADTGQREIGSAGHSVRVSARQGRA